MAKQLAPDELLLGSFLLQIMWTTLLGWAMLFPHQPWAKDSTVGKRLRSKDVTSAHVDWVMLALVQAGAALVIPRVQAALPNPQAIAWCLVFSGWASPLVYFLRAFGINGFRATATPSLAALAALVGFASTTSFTYAWAMLVKAWFFR